MKVVISTWFGDNEIIDYAENVNWGTDTLKFASTVENIVIDALKSYKGYPNKSVTAVTIDVMDEAVYAKEVEKWRKENGE